MDRLAELRARTPSMVEHLRASVEAESFSVDVDGAARCAEVIASFGSELLGTKPDFVRVDGHTHLLWRVGPRGRVLLIGHLDTVWPPGTSERWPFTIDGDRATGPGVFDMKSGIVQGLHALTTVAALDDVALLLTSDEEIGSPSSAALIKELAAEADAALILEPSTDGALKTARKGVSVYSIEIMGRAAHAGLEPEKGANALIELAHQVLALERIQDRDAGTTVTPTVGTAGSAANVVPARATIKVDVRVATIDEQQRVAGAMRALVAHTSGTTVRVDGDENRPPMEEASAAGLFARAEAIAAGLGIAGLRGVAVGGGSDGNFTAAAGCPTLDGLGGVGAGAHAEGEYVQISEMAPRAALLGGLVEELLREGRG